MLDLSVCGELVNEYALRQFPVQGNQIALATKPSVLQTASFNLSRCFHQASHCVTLPEH